jgi:hypothetical protein
MLPYGRLLNHEISPLRQKGKPIPTNDLWIAAIAKVHKLILVTNDEHFESVEDITCEDWTIPMKPSTSSSETSERQET